MIGWAVSDARPAYPSAVARMEERVTAIADGRDHELIWLLEHDHVYTAGRSACPEELADPAALPVHVSGRGGKYTYHGPGQRVIYIMLDLNRCGRDVRAFVTELENWIVDTLGTFGLAARTCRGRVGVWVPSPAPARTEDKIAAIGLRLRKWVSWHGISLNVHPDLDRYAGIIPCGVDDAELGVTSLHALGRTLMMAEVDQALKRCFEMRFGPTCPASPLL